MPLMRLFHRTAESRSVSPLWVPVRRAKRVASAIASTAATAKLPISPAIAAIRVWRATTVLCAACWLRSAVWAGGPTELSAWLLSIALPTILTHMSLDT